MVHQNFNNIDAELCLLLEMLNQRIENDQMHPG